MLDLTSLKKVVGGGIIFSQLPFFGSYQEGEFITTFTTNGKIIVYTDDFIRMEGECKIKGDEIVFIDNDGYAECIQEGRYRWRFNRKELSYRKIQDHYEGRAHHLTSRNLSSIETREEESDPALSGCLRKTITLITSLIVCPARTSDVPLL